MSQASLQNAMSISLMKKTMDQEQANAMQLIESMAAAVPPPSNHIIDVLA